MHKLRAINTNPANDGFADNQNIENEADSIIDFSEIDLTNILMITEINGLKEDANSLVKLAFKLVDQIVEADLKILKP